MLDPQNTFPSDSLTHHAGVPTTHVMPYEFRLAQDKEWGMNDASLFFDGKGKVHETLNRLTRELNERDIPYAIVGGLSLFEYGYRRFTEDVDLLVTKESQLKIHDELEGRGYLKPFSTSTKLRDTTTGVKIDFLITGGYPGDGKPGPLAFPDPREVFEIHGDKKYASLATIITLKIASGLTGKDRSKDFVDVEGLIKSSLLKRTFANQLPEYVRPKYFELWSNQNQDGKRYITSRVELLARLSKTNSGASLTPETIDDYIQTMISQGVRVEGDILYTFDRDIAKEFGMSDESDWFDP